MTNETICLPDMSAGGRPAHSPLGASSAERWMNCPGSVDLIRELTLPESDDPSYRAEGTAMHMAAEKCLRESMDPWEVVGEKFEGCEITPAMGDAIQIYLEACRADMAKAAHFYIEFPVSSPIHPMFYGTLDFAAIFGKPATPDQMKAFNWPEPFIVPELIRIRDLKGGEGIIVEPEENPQLKYYAYGLIGKNPHWADETPVLLEICQPRAFSLDGANRWWETTVGAIREWVHDTLVPAMARAEIDGTLDAGKWCRFCPAKLVCPLLTDLFKAASLYNPKDVVNFTDEQAAMNYSQVSAVKFYLKALEDDVYRRLNAGTVMTGYAKLVPKKSNRVFNPGAAALAKERFGDEAFTDPAMKSPAELEKISPAAREFVREFSHQPDTGLTVAAWEDGRGAVKVTTTQEAFGDAVKNLVDKENGAS